MNVVCLVYRRACRELLLGAADRRLLLRLLRELSVNTVQRRLAWNSKEQFITLWFVSAGRFPEIYQTAFPGWLARQLPFNIEPHEL